VENVNTRKGLRKRQK